MTSKRSAKLRCEEQHMTNEQAISDRSSKKKSRRLYRLLLCFTLLLLPLAVCLPIVTRYQQQMTLLDRIEQAGGLVGTKPIGPEWLRDFLGEQRMRGFENVYIINVTIPQITDEWLEAIANQTELENLALRCPQLSDAGLTHLKGLNNLEKLWLKSTRISDAGLVSLTGLTSLEGLSLDNTQISDTGLMHLKGLTNLRWLSLKYTQVSDAGLVHLNELTRLKSLYLNNTQISDAGLIDLKELTNLQVLNLSGTQVSDAGLVHLKGLSNLGELNLNFSQVSYAGVEELQTALPNCLIICIEDKDLPAKLFEAPSKPQTVH